MDAKIVRRKKSYVVYLKEGAQIVDILNIMEAHVALMNLENVRILKEMRNFVNRQVNCETANINKTVSAAVKQVEDINYIPKARWSPLWDGYLLHAHSATSPPRGLYGSLPVRAWLSQKACFCEDKHCGALQCLPGHEMLPVSE